MEERHYAIIGGGIGGLSAAYYLLQRAHAKPDVKIRCTIYERSERIGGNAYSAYLGEALYEPPFVDLAVNDFNKDQYHRLNAVLDTLEADGLPVKTAPIVDTTTWYTPAGAGGEAISYTEAELTRVLDGGDPPPGKEYLRAVARDWKDFEDIAYDVIHDPRYALMTVDDFIEDRNYSDAFANYNLLARINGMYYCTDRGPREMPIRAVMSYYCLQEGIGSKPGRAPTSHIGRRHIRKEKGHDHPDGETPRRYFCNGASDWILQLKTWLERKGVKFVSGAAPSVRAVDDGWEVRSTAAAGDGWQPYHGVISAIYAENVFKTFESGLSGEVTNLLGRFSYTDSISVVHEDHTMMPPEQGEWSTYNILIYPEDTVSLRPYTITYVCRMHQGERSTKPPYLTLTPLTPIPQSQVPNMINQESHGPGVPERALATAYFRHNLITFDSMIAQRSLQLEQGKGELYFTGGWTIGAGLHEEILEVSAHIADRILGYESGHGPVWYIDDDPHYVPPIFRRTMGHDVPV